MKFTDGVVVRFSECRVLRVCWVLPRYIFLDEFCYAWKDKLCEYALIGVVQDSSSPNFCMSSVTAKPLKITCQ